MGDAATIDFERLLEQLPELDDAAFDFAVAVLIDGELDWELLPRLPANRLLALASEVFASNGIDEFDKLFLAERIRENAGNVDESWTDYPFAILFDIARKVVPYKLPCALELARISEAIAGTLATLSECDPLPCDLFDLTELIRDLLVSPDDGARVNQAALVSVFYYITDNMPEFNSYIGRPEYQAQLRAILAVSADILNSDVVAPETKVELALAIERASRFAQGDVELTGMLYSLASTFINRNSMDPDIKVSLINAISGTFAAGRPWAHHIDLLHTADRLFSEPGDSETKSAIAEALRQAAELEPDVSGPVFSDWLVSFAKKRMESKADDSCSYKTILAEFLRAAVKRDPEAITVADLIDLIRIDPKARHSEILCDVLDIALEGCATLPTPRGTDPLAQVAELAASAFEDSWGEPQLSSITRALRVAKGSSAAHLQVLELARTWTVVGSVTTRTREDLALAATRRPPRKPNKKYWDKLFDVAEALLAERSCPVQVRRVFSGSLDQAFRPEYSSSVAWFSRLLRIAERQFESEEQDTSVVEQLAKALLAGTDALIDDPAFPFQDVLLLVEQRGGGQAITEWGSEKLAGAAALVIYKKASECDVAFLAPLIESPVFGRHARRALGGVYETLRPLHASAARQSVEPAAL